MASTRSLNDPVRVAECRRPIVRHIQCRSCGYEPENGHRLPYCPKCKGGCWETFVQVGKLRPAQTAQAAGSNGLPDAAHVGPDLDDDATV